MPKPKSEFDGRILPGILEFNTKIDDKLTHNANFLFGASTAIFFFSLNKLSQSDPRIAPALTVIIVGSFISMLASMTVFMPRPRMFSAKKRYKDDFFYYKNILKFYSRNTYADLLRSLPTDNKRIADAYATQVYTLAGYVLPYKARLIKISGWTLMASLLLGAWLYVAAVV